MAQAESVVEAQCVLIRYGAMGQVGRFVSSHPALEAGAEVVVETEQGCHIGCVVADETLSGEAGDFHPVLRLASESDHQAAALRREECQGAFPEWERRIREWEVDVQLIDLEQTLDGEKQILYVLNERGPETTKLALRAAAAGLGVVEVQPVGLDGLIETTGSGGCGCGH